MSAYEFITVGVLVLTSGKMGRNLQRATRRTPIMIFNAIGLPSI